MPVALRFQKNPVLAPNPDRPWEALGSFNGCPIIGSDGTHLVYRAQAKPMMVGGKLIDLSTIGHAISFDRVTFLNRRQLLTPATSWDKYGCEDPRVTKFGETYYIFYTAISSWPPEPSGISVGLATTHDFFTIDQRLHVTDFNSKAMTLFPERIDGKMAVLLTANCDIPPSTIGIAMVRDTEELADPAFWNDWYHHLDRHAVPLLRSDHDHVEIGAPPIRIRDGWLLVYSYIKSYRTSQKFFTVEAAVLDAQNPQIIIKRTPEPILFPQFDYEREGNLPNIVFPSGAILHNDVLGLYYGACDTSTCLATLPLPDLLESMISVA